MHTYTAVTYAPKAKTIIHIKILQSANEKYGTIMAPIQLPQFLLKPLQFQTNHHGSKMLLVFQFDVLVEVLLVPI